MKTFGISCVILAISFPLSFQSSAETTLRLATPGDPIADPVREVEITDSEIDAILGTTVFSTTANDLFADLAALRATVAVDIRDAFLSDPDRIKRIDSVVVQTNPVSAALSQAVTSIGLARIIHAGPDFGMADVA